MLSTLDRQPVPRVMVNHFWNGEIPPIKVTQLKISVKRIPADSHVHVASGAPENNHKFWIEYLKHKKHVFSSNKDKFRLFYFILFFIL